MLKRTDTKIIISGSIVEVHSYVGEPLYYGFTVFPNSKTRRKIEVIDEESLLRKSESRKRSMRRAGSNIRKLVNSNAWRWKNSIGIPYEPIFVTLTFKDDVRDVRKANAEFTHFIRRLNYKVSGKSNKFIFKYISVIEFQDLNRGGVIHYHTVFFNLPTAVADILSQIWGHGFIDKKKIEEIDNVGAYISKSLSSAHDDSRLDGNKHYFSSSGLLQPIEIREQGKAQAIKKLLLGENIAKVVDNSDRYQGRVERVSYQLNKSETLSDTIPEVYNLP
ncbi:MAG: hypothetical protein Q7S04_01425 [Candidatus Moranbacteria bacterium]|nr:hypothetical protein [Candidatus Moranbacteria bacterium]